MTIKKRQVYFTFILVVIIQLVLGFQGFDVCDDGFAATFYQQFFNDADSVEYNFVYWLSGLIGGIWYNLWPSGGVLWLKVLAILVNTSTMFLAYRLLQPYIKQTFLLPALAMTMFINDYDYLLFYNNHITAFLAVLSFFCMHRGLSRSNMKLLLLSGILIGLNVFSRVPNLSQVALILAIPFYYGLKGDNTRTILKASTVFVLGILLGFVLIAILLVGLDQFKIMTRALLSLFDLGQTDNSSHNIRDLFGAYFRNYLKVGFYFFLAAIVLLTSFKVRSLISKSLMRWITVISVFILSLAWFKLSNIYGFYALGYIGVLYVVLSTKDKEFKLIAIMASIMQLLLPFGSGGGITSIGYASLWLSLPLFFFLLQNWSEGGSFDGWSSKLRIGYSQSFNGRPFVLALFLGFMIIRLYSWSQLAYFDPGPRLDKTYAINSKFAKGIYTTQQRADIINSVLDVLPRYVSPNDYLFVYDKTPMIHFLTETRPFMYNSWPWIYDAITFEKKLEEALLNRDELPVIVVQKFETIKSFSEPNPDYLSSEAEEDYLHTNRTATVMKAFLIENNYQKDWSNDYFEIHIPNKVEQ